MFSLYRTNTDTSNAQSNNKLATGGNDPRTTKAMRFASLVESGGTNITYRAPRILGNVYSFNDPVFNGQVTVQGNLTVDPGGNVVVTTNAYNPATTGYIKVIKDIIVGGDIRVMNDVVIGGKISFLSNTGYDFVGNVFSPMLNTPMGSANSLFVNRRNYKTNADVPIFLALGTGIGVDKYNIGFSSDGGLTFKNPKDLIPVAPKSKKYSIIFRTTEVVVVGDVFKNQSVPLNHCTSAVWNGSYWVATGCGNYTIAWSSDSINWTGVEPKIIFTIAPEQSVIGGAYGSVWNGTFWIVCGYGSNRCFARSYDGFTWTTDSMNHPFLDITNSASVSSNVYASTIAWNGSMWVAGSSYGSSSSGRQASIAYSTDSFLWTAVDTSNTLIIPGGVNTVVWNGIYWIAAGGGTVGGSTGSGSQNNFAYSNDGIHWTGYNSPIFTDPVKKIAWNPHTSMWFAVGLTSESTYHLASLAYSTDGLEWQRINSEILKQKSIYDILWNAKGDQCYAVGQQGNSSYYLYSSDGFTWTSVKTSGQSTANLIGIASSESALGLVNVSGKVQISESLAVAKYLSVNGGVTSSSTDTGTMVVHGGVGIQENLNVGGNIVFSGTKEATSTTSAGLVVGGGAGIGGNLFVRGNVTMYGTTESTSTNTGSLILGGGMGVGGNMYIGKNITAYGTQDSDNNLWGTGAFVVAGGASIAKSMFIGNSVTIAGSDDAAMVVIGGASIAKNMLIGNSITISGTSNASSYTSSCAMVVSGGASIGANTYIGGNVHVAYTMTIDSSNTNALHVKGGAGIDKDLIIGNSVVIGNAIDVSGGVNIGKSVSIGNTIQILGNIPSNSVSQGTLTVVGGAGIDGNVYIGKTVHILGTNTPYALDVSNSGANIGGALRVKNSITVTGGDLNIDSGSATISGGITANSFNTSGSLSAGATSVSSISASGSATIQNGLTVITGNLDISSGNLNINGGGANISGTLTLTDLDSIKIGEQSFKNAIAVGLFTGLDATFTNKIHMTNSENANSNDLTSGTLLVSGGSRIKGNIIAGNGVLIQGIKNSIDISSGALVVYGGMGINRDVNIGGKLIMNNNAYQNLSGNNIYFGNKTTNESLAFNQSETTFNTVIGYNTYTGGSYGTENVAVGHNTLYRAQVGNYNTAIGGNSLIRIISPTYNTAIGYGSGISTLIGTDNENKNMIKYNTFLGANTTINGPYNNSTAIGYGAMITGNNLIVFGTSSERIVIPGQFSLDGGLKIGEVTQTDTDAVGKGTLIVNGGMSTTGNAVIGNILYVLGNIPANSTDSGSVRVLGGMGITGNVFVGNRLVIRDTTPSDGIRTDNGALIVSGGVGIGGATTMGGNVRVLYTIDSSSVDTGALVVSGGVGIGKNVCVGGNVLAGGNVWIGGNLNVENGMILKNNLDVSGNVRISGYTQLVGNMDICGNLNVYGNTLHQGYTQCIGNTLLSGNTSILGNLDICGNNNVWGNSLVTGIFGVVGNTSLNGNVSIVGDSYQTGNIVLNGVKSGIQFPGGSRIDVSGSNLNIGSDLFVNGNLSLVGNQTIYINGVSLTQGTQSFPNQQDPINFASTSYLNFYGTEASTSATTGVIRVVAGGIGVKGNSFFGNDVAITGGLSAGSSYVMGTTNTNTLTVLSNASIGSTVDAINTHSGALTVGGGIGMGGNIFIGGNAQILSTTDSSSVATGALVVSGGIGIGGNTYIGNYTEIQSTQDVWYDTTTRGSTGGALHVRGGAGIEKGMIVGNSVIIKGYDINHSTTPALQIKKGGLYVNGTTTMDSNVSIGGDMSVAGSIVAYNTECATAITSALYSYTTKNSLTIVLGPLNHYYTSTDGITWTNRTFDWDASGGYAIEWNGYLWVTGLMANGNNCLAFSIDGISWQTAQTPFVQSHSIYITALRWNGFLWVAGGKNFTSNKIVLVYSIDGKNWNFCTLPETNLPTWEFVWNVTSNGAKWIAGGQSFSGITTTSMLISTDGKTWDLVQNYPFDRVYGLATNGIMWIATGYNTSVPYYTIAYSYDGLIWDNVVESIDWFLECEDVAYNGYIWVAVGTKPSVIRYSLDGLTWNQAEIASNIMNVASKAGSLVWNPDLKTWFVTFYESQNPYYILQSTDGINWMELSVVILNEELYAIACTGTNTGKIVSQNTATMSGLTVLNNAFVGGKLYISEGIYLNNEPFVGSGGGVSSTGDVSFNGNIIVYTTTPSTSINSGAFQLVGGAGITGNIYVGGNVIVQSNIASMDVSSGAFQVVGGAGITGNVYVGGNVVCTSVVCSSVVCSSGNMIVQSNIASMDVSSGAFQVLGGAGITGNVYVGGNVVCSTSVVCSSVVCSSGNMIVQSNIASMDVFSGSLQVIGGAGITGNVYVGGNITIGALTANSGATINGGLLTASQGATISGGLLTANSGATIDGGLLTASQGATVSGGLFSVLLGATISGGLLTANSGATISGGLLTASQGATVSGGQLNVYGTAQFTSIPTIADIATLPTDSNHFITKAYADNNYLVSGGSSSSGSTSSTLTSAIIITDTSPAIDTNSGALRVSGGVGISGNVYVGSNISVAGSAQFTSLPTISDVNILPTASNQFITKAYADKSYLGGGGSSASSSTTLVINTATASFGGNLVVGKDLTTGLIQYFPFTKDFSNYATGLPVSNDIMFSTVNPSLKGEVDSSLKYRNVIDATSEIDANSLVYYYPFDYPPVNDLTVKEFFNNSDPTYAIFLSYTRYMTNLTYLYIPTTFTISFWINLDSIGSSNGAYPTDHSVPLVCVSNNLMLSMDTNGYLSNNFGQTSPVPVPPGAFSYVSWVYDAGVSTMYLYSYPYSYIAWTDTSNITITSLPNAYNPNSVFIAYDPLTLPAATTNDYKFGMVDFRLYSRALSSSEITKLYTQYNTYTNALAIPTSTTEIVAGDLGVTGNVIALNNIGIGTLSPQYNLDVSGNMNVSGMFQRSYQELPLFTSPSQIGYTVYGTFVNEFTLEHNNVTNLGNLILPVGVWMLNAQVGLLTSNGTATVTVTSTTVSISDSASYDQVNGSAPVSASYPTQYFAFSQMCSSMTIGQNDNNKYCSNISQVFSNYTVDKSLYVNVRFSGTVNELILDTTRSFFTATRIA